MYDVLFAKKIKTFENYKKRFLAYQKRFFCNLRFPNFSISLFSHFFIFLAITNFIEVD